MNLVGADLRVSIPAAGALVTAYAPGLGIGAPIDRADGWNLVAGVSLHRPHSVPPYVPDITARFPPTAPTCTSVSSMTKARVAVAKTNQKRLLTSVLLRFRQRLVRDSHGGSSGWLVT